MVTLAARTPSSDEYGNHLSKGCHFGSDIFDFLFKVRAIMERVRRGNRDLDFVHQLVEDCESAIIGYRRPIDEYLDKHLFYTRREFITIDRISGDEKNPLVVDATITSRGNLSVRASLARLSEGGHTMAAVEWTDIPFFGTAAIMERRSDEVLFIRGAERLLAGHASRYLEREPKDADLFNALANLVAGVFNEVCERVARKFDVVVRDNLVIASKGLHGHKAFGVSIIDGAREIRRQVEANVMDFEAEYGWSPDAFLHEVDASCSRTKLLNTLRSKEGRRRINPSDISRMVELLNKAERFGLFRPRKGG